MFKSSTFISLVATGFAAAQLGNLGLSAPCEGALNAAVSNQGISQCLNVIDAVNIVTLTANNSVIPPINTWLQGLCAAAPCDNSTLSTVAQNISTNCQSDLQKIGISASTAQTIAADFVQFYPTIRKIACLKESSNNTLCVSTVLTDLQTSLGQPLSLNTIIQDAPQIAANPQNVSKSVLCNECTEGAWSILKQDIPGLASDNVITSVVSQECGADFANSTSLPANVAEGTGTAAPTGSLGATPSGAAGHAVEFVSSRALLGIGFSSLVTIFAGSAILI